MKITEMEAILTRQDKGGRKSTLTAVPRQHVPGNCSFSKQTALHCTTRADKPLPYVANMEARTLVFPFWHSPFHQSIDLQRLTKASYASPRSRTLNDDIAGEHAVKVDLSRDARKFVHDRRV